MEEDESSADIVVGYALEGEDVLLECPLSNSWSFPGVGYQDTFLFDREEEDDGRVSTVCLIILLWYISDVICISSYLTFV